jgi:hypothetical protein
LREVFCLVLGFREKKWTFTKIEGDNMDFFRKEKLAAFVRDTAVDCTSSPTTVRRLRPPLVHRNFIGKIKDSLSYRIQHCSTLWLVGLNPRKCKGNIPSQLIS